MKKKEKTTTTSTPNLYNMEAAKKAGLKPDKTGHWGSRVPAGKSRGLILKDEKHPTFHKTIAAEGAAGYKVYKNTKTKALHSFPGKEKVGKEYEPYKTTTKTIPSQGGKAYAKPRRKK